MLNRRFASLLPLAVMMTLGCSSESSNDSASQDVVVATATVIAQCTGKDGTPASVTIEANQQVSYRTGNKTVTGGLTDVDGNANPNHFDGYNLTLSTGAVTIDFQEKAIGETNALVECDPSSFRMDESAFEKLSKAADDSKKQATTFASCDGSRDLSLRPAALGSGAIIEGELVAPYDGQLSYFVTAIDAPTGASGVVTLRGVGDYMLYASEPVASTVTTITATATGDGKSALSWDAKHGDQATEMPKTNCTLPGLARAQTLANAAP